MDMEKETKLAKRHEFWRGIVTFLPLYLVALQLLVAIILFLTLDFEAVRISNYIFLGLIVGSGIYSVFVFN